MTNYERHKRDLEGIAGKAGRCFCVDVAAAAGVECKAEGETCGACMLRVMAWAAAEYAEPEPIKGLERVEYIAHSGHYSFIHYAGGRVEKVRLRHSRLEEILAPWARFVTTAKGLIVNLEYVTEARADELLMESGARVPISRRRESEVRRAFLEYSESTGRCLYFRAEA